MSTVLPKARLEPGHRDPSKSGPGSAASSALRQRRVVSAYQAAPGNFDRSFLRQPQQRVVLSRPHIIMGHQRDSSGSCYCIQCAASSVEGRRRQGLSWQGPSPYLEDLTKRLVKPQPGRRKLQLVPQLRMKTTIGSPYEPRGYGRAAYGQPFRSHLQAELTERQARLLWQREVAAGAERAGVDLGTYSTLLELQHRDITPEDYDVLQQLDSSLKPKTVDLERLEQELPAWRVPHDGEGGPSDAPVCLPSIEDDARCSVCLEKFIPGQMARTLPCGHFFHQQCIDVWLTESSNVCPDDNMVVFPEHPDEANHSLLPDHDDDDAAER